MVKQRVGPIATPLTAQSSSKTRIVTGDIIQKAAQQKKIESSKRRRAVVNTDTLAGFNGSVPVPGPSKIFTRGPGTTNTAAAQQSHSVPTSSARCWRQHEKSADDVLAKQQKVAALLRERKESAENRLRQQGMNRAQKKGERKENSQSSASARESLLFSHLGDIDVEKVLATKSRFADEALADEYARSRRVVTELEAEESTKEQTNNKKERAGSKNNPIEKEWHCLACKRTFSKKPEACIRRSHTVKIKRSIRACKTKADKRQDLTDRSVEDGGLKLSSGLDWSRNNYSRFS